MQEPKLIVVTKLGDKSRGNIQTEFVYDNRTKRLWTREQIIERGIVSFNNESDMKETLNWNLNGDSEKYQYNIIGTSYFTALIYD